MKFKKGDFVILFILVIAGISWLALSHMGNAANAERIVIEVNGETYKVIPMKEVVEEQHLHIGLADGKYIDLVVNKEGVYVSDVKCPDKLCQKTGVINRVGQSIVCLPNKVTVFIEGKKQSDVDNVSY